VAPRSPYTRPGLIHGPLGRVHLHLQANASPARMARTSSAAAARSAHHAHRAVASARERTSSSPSQGIGKRSGAGPDETLGTLSLTAAHTRETVRALMNTSFDENVIPHFAAGMRRRPAASLRTRALRSTSATRRRPATAVCSVCLRRQPAQTSARRASPPSCFSTSSRTGPSLSPSSTT
jgi:hypothetical protein